MKLYKYKSKLYGHIIDYYIDTNYYHYYLESIMNALSFLKAKKSNIFSLWCHGDKKLLKTIKYLGFKKYQNDLLYAKYSIIKKSI